MARSFTVAMRDSNTGEVDRTCVVIPDEDWGTLIAYSNGVVEIEKSASLQSGIRSTFAIRGNLMTGISTEGSLPSNDTIAALLHRVRPFVLQKEPASFFKVRNILAKHVDNVGFRLLLDQTRDLFSGKDFQNQLRITTTTLSFTDVLNSEESFQTWVNGFEYHQDREKQLHLQQLCGVLPFDAARMIFVSMLIDKLKAILELATIIRHCERGDGQPLRIP